MSQSAKISTFSFGSDSVRIVVRDGEPWFVASDVCAALDYANTSKAVADHLDEDERSNEQLDRYRMGSKSVIINESGLYALVLRSRKPQARKFAKWVTGDVLPSIRKTGSYASTTEPQGYVPEVAFPPDVQAALDSKAWELTAQAQRIVRNYLRIKVDGDLERAFDKSAVLKRIDETTLDDAFVPLKPDLEGCCGSIFVDSR